MGFFENFGGGDAKRIKAEQAAKEKRDEEAMEEIRRKTDEYTGPVKKEEVIVLDPKTGLKSDGSFARKDHT